MNCEKLCDSDTRFPVVFQSVERPHCFGKADMADFTVPEVSKESP